MIRQCILHVCVCMYVHTVDIFEYKKMTGINPEKVELPADILGYAKCIINNGEKIMNNTTLFTAVNRKNRKNVATPEPNLLSMTNRG